MFTHRRLGCSPWEGALLFIFRRLEVRQGPILKLRPWRDGPQAIAILKLARGVAVSTGGAYASNWFFSNSSLLAPNTLRYFKRLPRKIFSQRFWVFPLATCTLRLTGNERWRKIGWKNVCKLWLQERTPEQLKGEGD
jgi:hypothetical protein